MFILLAVRIESSMSPHSPECGLARPHSGECGYRRRRFNFDRAKYCVHPAGTRRIPRTLVATTKICEENAMILIPFNDSHLGNDSH